MENQNAWKSKEAREICEAILQAKPEFKKRKSGQVYKEMLATVASVFKEDRALIYQLFGTQKANQRKRGGATIHSTATQKKGHVRHDGSDCEGCPQVVMEDGAAKPMAIHKMSVDPAERFSTAKAVLEAFGSQEAPMRFYCDQNGIRLGKAQKPETIAEKIHSHYHPQD